MELQETGLIPLPCTLHCSKGELHFLELILLGCACKENSFDKRVLEGGIFSLGAAPGQAEVPSHKFHPCADVEVAAITSAQPVCAQSCN